MELEAENWRLCSTTLVRGGCATSFTISTVKTFTSKHRHTHTHTHADRDSYTHTHITHRDPRTASTYSDTLMDMRTELKAVPHAGLGKTT